jgi:hypothetical protein
MGEIHQKKVLPDIVLKKIAMLSIKDMPKMQFLKDPEGQAEWLKW